MANNRTDEPPGDPADDRIVPYPPNTPIRGAYTTLEPLSTAHSASLFKHIGGAANADLWTFMARGAILDQKACDDFVAGGLTAHKQQYFVVLNPGGGEALGVVTYMNIFPEHRCLEIGSIVLGKELKRTRMATEAFYLLLKRAFDELGFQRVEWKANSLNKPSLAAAERLGFVFEGIFRKHWIVRGKRRDTAWYSIIDDDWPVVKGSFEAWLDDSNFDIDGKQKRRLGDIRRTWSEGSQ